MPAFYNCFSPLNAYTAVAVISCTLLIAIPLLVYAALHGYVVCIYMFLVSPSHPCPEHGMRTSEDHHFCRRCSRSTGHG